MADPERKLLSSSFASALVRHQVTATVHDIDYIRVSGSLAVETDYIIEIRYRDENSENGEYASFKTSKTFKSFRTLAANLRKAADTIGTKRKKKLTANDTDGLFKSSRDVLLTAKQMTDMIEHRGKSYFGKLSYTHVKNLSKKREKIINEVLHLILSHYPTANFSTCSGTRIASSSIESFFLTDHMIEDEESQHGKVHSLPNVSTPPPKPEQQPIKECQDPVVTPKTYRRRRSTTMREEEEMRLELTNESLFLEEDELTVTNATPSALPPQMKKHDISSTTPSSRFFDNPTIFALFCILSMGIIYRISLISVSFHVDIMCLALFTSFCIGRNSHVPKENNVIEVLDKPQVQVQVQRLNTSRRVSMVQCPAALLKQSMIRIKSTEDLSKDTGRKDHQNDTLTDNHILSPLPTFPSNGDPNTDFNFVSEPKGNNFLVRGPNYLEDHRKIYSQDAIFPMRGVDLFLTDHAPENVGSNPGILAGKLRDTSTFIINFRLPWGVLICYFEIPPKLTPFLLKSYDPTTPLPSTKNFSPGERLAAKFLMADDTYRNHNLKILPVVVIGPWVVKKVAGGKPAILGNKLPVTYIYQPSSGNMKDYLEADLDIVASSAARGILSVVRQYTQGVTLDMGFVIQGNDSEELPECMLTTTRIHGLDPMNASPLPPMADEFDHLFGEEEGMDKSDCF